MAGKGDGGGGATRVLKAICVAFVLVFSIWFLLMGMSSGEYQRRTAAVSTSRPGNHKHTTLLGKKKRHSVPVKLDPNYVSKRRVPSGPDPIHNRDMVDTCI